MTTILRARGPVLLLAVLLVLLSALAGCGGSGSDESGDRASVADSSTAGGGLGEPEGDGGLAEDVGGDTDSGKVASTDSATRALTRSIISRGEIGLTGDSVAAMRSEVLRLVTTWQGIVTEEQSSGDQRGRLTDSTLTLRVPSDRFDTAMTRLAEVGRVTHQTRSAEDVSTQVIDTEARVRAAERSIRQIELLLSRADRIADIIAIESELSRRQAELDSLKSQRAYLADQTSQSTITVYLQRTGADGEGNGFIDGLRDGWDALKDSAAALVTALGAAIPFAVALALVAVPVWFVVRRRRGNRPRAAATPGLTDQRTE